MFFVLGRPGICIRLASDADARLILQSRGVLHISMHTIDLWDADVGPSFSAPQHFLFLRFAGGQHLFSEATRCFVQAC